MSAWNQYRSFSSQTLALALAALLGLSSSPADTAETFSQPASVAKAQVRNEPAAANSAPSLQSTALADGLAPTWIWGANPNKEYRLRTEFNGRVKAAWLKATCDNHMTLFINGQKVTSSESWQAPVEVNIQEHLRPGKNELIAEVANAGGSSGFLCKIVLVDRIGEASYVVSDETWKAAEKDQPDKWASVKTLGKMGVKPWGDVFTKADATPAQPREVFHLQPGFQVEHLFTVPKEKLGSWVNITSDSQGRLIVSDQGNLGLCRITPAPIGSPGETKVELLDIKIDGKQMSGAQGLLFAFDSLYVVCNGGPGSGLYRCRDTNGDDQFDKVELLKAIPGGGEHGPHAIRLSPDGESLFVAAGNHTKLPFEIKTNAPPQTMGGQRTEQLRATLPEGVTSRIVPNWDEDTLLPRQWDAGGHAVGILAPGGWICKTDPDGKTWEVFSVGYRNQYDFAFNADGEMFAYDSDMEWDFGSPWYRPTRVNHVTSGSEFGWRSGTSNWPAYYVDSLPPMIDIGPGSPVGVEFGYGTKFPAKYQKALYICDWTFGTMYAIHIEPSGSSYKATKEEFISRTPLPLTDCTVGKDGALYFTIGGRGAQSELFRATYVGDEDTQPVELRDPRFADERQERQSIEKLHESPIGEIHNGSELHSLVDQLGSLDRNIAYAARVALERVPAEVWQDKVFADSSDTGIIIIGCVGLARQAEPALLPKILQALDRLDWSQIGEDQQLAALRAYQLAFIRLGNPDDATKARLAKKFEDYFTPDPRFVSDKQKSEFIKRELAVLMIHFESPGTLKKLLPVLARERVVSQEEIGGDLLGRHPGYGGTIAAMLANQPDQQAYHYAFHLRNLKTGWTMQDRQAYFAWFDKARQWSGGASYIKFLNNIDNEAFTSLTDAERLSIEASGARKPYVIPELPVPKGPGQDYSVDDVIALASGQLTGRNFKNGERMYKAARCVVCHRFGGEGGATGPDLTQLAGRFNLKDLTDAIVDPSKVISDQYKASVIETKDGKVIQGRIVSESNDSITVVIDPEIATKVEQIKKSDIEANEPSKVSLMPKDLLKSLNEAEVLDLLAYLLSRGNPNDAMFRK